MTPASEQSLPERLRANLDFLQQLHDACYCDYPEDPIIDSRNRCAYCRILEVRDEIERQQVERDKPFFVKGVGFRSPDEAVMHLLAERAQTKAELERLRGELKEKENK